MRVRLWTLFFLFGVIVAVGIGNRIGIELDRSVDEEIQMGDDRWGDSSVREKKII